MQKNELDFLLEKITPKLFNFTYGLTGEELSAEQLILDSYTVFLMENKDFLSSQDYDSSDRLDRNRVTKFLYREMVREVFDLGVKRAHQYNLGGHELQNPEFKDYFQVSIKKRAVLFLKEVEGFTITELQEVFTLDRYQVVELYHNAKHEVLGTKSEKSLNTNTDHKYSALVSAYAYGTLRQKDIPTVEELIGQNDELSQLFTQRLEEKDFLLQLIPQMQFQKNSLSYLKKEMSQISENIFPKEKLGWLGKATKALNKPIITIEY